MHFCNSCSKPKSSCNCPQEPTCDHGPKCGCGGAEIVHKFDNKSHCCDNTCKPTCNQSSKQFDTRDIFYKIKGDCFSNLDNLGIEKGASLEYIIETFGRFINSFNYFDIAGNIYDAKDFTEFMNKLQEDIHVIKNDINSLCDKYESIQIQLNTVNNRLSKLEKPEILDTKGIGFTKFDTIFKVLQKLSDNAL